jgi:hypothetical protein
MSDMNKAKSDKKNHNLSTGVNVNKENEVDEDK